MFVVLYALVGSLILIMWLLHEFFFLLPFTELNDVLYGDIVDYFVFYSFFKCELYFLDDIIWVCIFYIFLLILFDCFDIESQRVCDVYELNNFDVFIGRYL
jgi:hypothetical protein